MGRLDKIKEDGESSLSSHEDKVNEYKISNNLKSLSEKEEIDTDRQQTIERNLENFNENDNVIVEA